MQNVRSVIGAHVRSAPVVQSHALTDGVNCPHHSAAQPLAQRAQQTDFSNHRRSHYFHRRPKWYAALLPLARPLRLLRRKRENCSTLRWSRSCNRFVIIGMSADDLPRPNKFFVRRNDFSESRSNDPQRNTSCDQRVKKRMSGDGEQESREHRSKGDVNVA